MYDQVNGWGLRYQPELYEMTEDIGDYPAGTLLVAANSIPTDLSETKIDVYASTDEGCVHFRGWEEVESVLMRGLQLHLGLCFERCSRWCCPSGEPIRAHMGAVHPHVRGSDRSLLLRPA